MSSVPFPFTKRQVFDRTQHIKGYRRLSEGDVVLTRRHLTAVLPRVFLCDGVDRQSRSLYFSPSCIRACSGQVMEVV